MMGGCKFFAPSLKGGAHFPQINKIRSERGELKTDITDIQRIKGTTIGNCMPIKWTAWEKWTSS